MSGTDVGKEVLKKQWDSSGAGTLGRNDSFVGTRSILSAGRFSRVLSTCS